jgi:hypothetical protein
MVFMAKPVVSDAGILQRLAAAGDGAASAAALPIRLSLFMAKYYHKTMTIAQVTQHVRWRTDELVGCAHHAPVAKK